MRRQQGSALLIVITLLTVLSALIIANDIVLRQLHAELQRLDHRQQQELAREHR